MNRATTSLSEVQESSPGLSGEDGPFPGGPVGVQSNLEGGGARAPGTGVSPVSCSPALSVLAVQRRLCPPTLAPSLVQLLEAGTAAAPQGRRCAPWHLVIVEFFFLNLINPKNSSVCICIGSERGLIGTEFEEKLGECGAQEGRAPQSFMRASRVPRGCGVTAPVGALRKRNVGRTRMGDTFLCSSSGPGRPSSRFGTWFIPYCHCVRLCKPFYSVLLASLFLF